MPVVPQSVQSFRPPGAKPVRADRRTSEEDHDPVLNPDLPAVSTPTRRETWRAEQARIAAENGARSAAESGATHPEQTTVWTDPTLTTPTTAEMLDAEAPADEQPPAPQIDMKPSAPRPNAECDVRPRSRRIAVALLVLLLTLLGAAAFRVDVLNTPRAVVTPPRAAEVPLSPVRGSHGRLEWKSSAIAIATSFGASMVVPSASRLTVAALRPAIGAARAAMAARPLAQAAAAAAPGSWRLVRAAASGPAAYALRRGASRIAATRAKHAVAKETLYLTVKYSTRTAGQRVIRVPLDVLAPLRRGLGGVK